MSKQNEIDVVEGGRSVEPWFAVLLSSLLPLIAAVMLPESWRMPLYVGGGVLTVVGVGLLIKQERNR